MLAAQPHIALGVPEQPKREDTKNWLLAQGFPPLPVAPKQDPRRFHKVEKANAKRGTGDYCPLTEDLQPVPLYTGKNPSYLDANGTPHPVKHSEYRKRQPTQEELDLWFANPDNGIGTLGSPTDIWLDFDVKNFSTALECKVKALAVAQKVNESSGQLTTLEETHSGGWRVYTGVPSSPGFKNFALTPGGKHVGEAIGEGSFTVLAPTIGPSGKPYVAYHRHAPDAKPQVPNLKNLDVHSCKSEKSKAKVKGSTGGGKGFAPKAAAKSKTFTPKANVNDYPELRDKVFDLADLGTDKTRNVLSGVNIKGNRSESLATAIPDLYGWEDWCNRNGITYRGNTEALAHVAGERLGLDAARVDRILDGIDADSCVTSCEFRGGNDDGCWKRIFKLAGIRFKSKKRSLRKRSDFNDNGNDRENNIVPHRSPDESKSILEIQSKLRSFTYPIDIELNQQYLPDDLDTKLIKSGVVCVKAAKGSGKSTMTEKVVAHGKRENRPVISLTSRINLGEEQAAKWGMHYIDNLPVKYTIETTPTLVVCWDSLPKLLGKDLTNGILIIDESELGVMHLTTSDTCKDKRSQILATFEKIIKEVLESGGLVILADADLTDVSVKYVRDLAPKDTPFFSVVNHHKGKPWSVKFMTGNRHPLQRRIVSSIKAGNKIAIATDSQAESEKLEAFLKRECPGIKIRRVDSKTSKLEFTKGFIKNINVELVNDAPDVLIYTPSMGVGVSIDVPYFDEVYGFFFGKLEPSQCRQMLARVRCPVPRYVWAMHGNYQMQGSKSFLPGEIKQTLYHYHKGGLNVTDLAVYLVKLKNQSDNDTDIFFHQRLITTLQEMMTPEGTWRNAHVDLYADVKARANYGRTHLAEMLRQELIDEGHDLGHYKLNKNGAERIEANGTLTPAEIPVTLSDATLQQLAQPVNVAIEAETPLNDEMAETLTPEGLTPEQCAPNTIYNCGDHCSIDAQRQAIEEATKFTISDVSANQRTQAAMKALVAEKEEKEAERWYQTAVVTKDEAYEIKRNPFASEEDQIKAQKTLLAESLPGRELTKEFLLKAIIRRGLTEVKNYWRLTHPEETKRQDRKTWIYHLQEFASHIPFLPDVMTHEPKFQVLRDVGLLNFTEDVKTEYHATARIVQEFFEACWRNRLKLKTTWGIVVTRNSKPIDLLNRLLEKVGLRLKTTRHARMGRDRIRFYALDETLVNDPERLATLAAMDRKYVEGVSPQTLTQQGLTPEQCAPNIINNSGNHCSSFDALPQTTSAPVRVRGKTIRILGNGDYPEVMGVVVQSNTSDDWVTARILDGEYKGAEWVLPGGDYVLVGG